MYEIQRVSQEQEALEAIKVINKHLADRYLEDVLCENTLCLAVKYNDKIIAAATASLTDTKEDLFPPGQKHLAQKLSFHNKAIEMKVSAVEKEHRNQGLGFLLTKKRLEWGIQQQASLALCSAWLYPDGSIPARAQLLANGFNEFMTIKEYWKEDSIVNSYDCRICKNPCLCSSTIFVWEE